MYRRRRGSPGGWQPGRGLFVPPPPAGHRLVSARRHVGPPPSPRSASRDRESHPRSWSKTHRTMWRSEVAVVGDPLLPSPRQAPMMGHQTAQLGDVITLMTATMLHWKPRQLLRPIETDLTGCQLLAYLGSLPQASAGPTDATGRLLRHVSPGRHPFHNRPVPIRPMRTTRSFLTNRGHLHRPPRGDLPFSPDDQLIQLILGQLPPIHTHQPTNRLGQEFSGTAVPTVGARGQVSFRPTNQAIPSASPSASASSRAKASRNSPGRARKEPGAEPTSLRVATARMPSGASRSIMG